MARLTLAIWGGLMATIICVFGGRHDQDLTAFLLSDYDSRVYPGPVRTEIGVSLIRIVGLDSEKGVLTVNVWFEMFWKDDRLAWNDRPEFGDIEHISLPASALWVPDIILYNSADGFTSFNKDVRAIIYNDGKVIYMPPMTFNTFCSVGMDTNVTGLAHCGLKFGSWTYNQGEVDLHPIIPSVSLGDYAQTGPWMLANSSATRNEMHYECCPETPYVDVTYKIILKRDV